MPGQIIFVKLDGNKTVELQVEEFHPLDRAAYVTDPGWTCYDLNTDTEYFVSKDGSVYLQPENRCVGVAPVIREQADRLEEFMSRSEEQ